MTPEEALGADVLGSAARTIGEMPEEAVQSKFAQLQQMRGARTEREIIRQQAEADSLEGDEAAYQAGLMHEKSDLKKAARPRSTTSPGHRSSSPRCSPCSRKSTMPRGKPTQEKH